MALTFLRRNWFMLGLIGVTLATLVDTAGITSSLGRWLGANRGPDAIIVIIFLLSGLALDTGLIRDGLADVRGTMLALMLIFLITPLLAFFFAHLPLAPGIVIGLFLVGVMPSTLSSGVVMTRTAGGNMAHALLITIIANVLAAISVPITLGLLLNYTGYNRAIEISLLPIVFKIAALVLLPLLTGNILRRAAGSLLQVILPYTAVCNQLGVLAIVWVALSAGRNAIVNGLDSVVLILVVVCGFHLTLAVTALIIARAASIPKGRRESVVIMSGQKTLPLSVILQVSLFPEFGIALVVCVLHHIVHLIMDAYLVHYLQDLEA